MSAIDERKGLPSGSSALYDKLCPGRWRAQKEWQAISGEPPAENPHGEDPPTAERTALEEQAASGRRIHAIYAGEEAPGATDDEIRIAERAREIDKKMYREWLHVFEVEPVKDVIELKEVRWWLKDNVGKELYSGQTDRLWIRGTPFCGEPADILLADLKGLYGVHDDAPLNVQIRRYIALIAHSIGEYGFSGVRTAMAYLNQPVKTADPKPVQFEEPDLAAAVEEMIQDVNAMLDEEAPRIPGPVQCAKCRAQIICNEFGMALANMPVVGAGTTPAPPEKKEIEKSVALLPSGRLAFILNWAEALTNLVDLAKTEARKRLRADPTCIPGWGLHNNPPRRRITDMALLLNNLNETFGVTEKEFIQECTTTIEAVGKIVASKTPLRGRALEERVKVALDGTTTPRPVSPSLEKQ